MNTKLVYVVTIGCQMNVYDTGQIIDILFLCNYTETKVIEEADLIIVNTCAIRVKAEHKAFSFLGKMSKLKIRNPLLIVGVGGCVAQQYGSDIIKRIPSVDLVFGTDAILRLAKLISRIELTRCKIVDTDVSLTWSDHDFFLKKTYKSKKISAYVTIMRGCDNYCTYCIVPYVRGREISRNPEMIIKEIEKLVDSGVREVVLLGQNVNSYGVKEGLLSFAELLDKVNEINDLKRIRFITSHPKDLSEDLIDRFCSINKLCKHIHLPVQSGDNTILKRMNRGYSIEQYVNSINKLRYKCPSISISSDFIVGFPGETNQQFKATLSFIKKIRFNSLYVFSYSDRSKAASSKFDNKITEIVKRERLHSILNLQSSITQEINNSMIGTVNTILVERASNSPEFNRDINFTSDNVKSNLTFLVGRNQTNQIVHFAINSELDSKKLIGNLVKVRIIEANFHFLRGELSDSVM